MTQPIIGIESAFFSIILAIILLLYIPLFLPIVKRGFKYKTINRWNNVFLCILIAFVAIAIALPFAPLTTYYLFMPMCFYAIVVAGAIPLVFAVGALIKKSTSDEIAHYKQLSEGLDETLKKSLQDTHNFTPKQEFQRKMFHLLAILYIMVWVLEPLVFYGVGNLYAGIANTPTAENYGNAAMLFEDSDVKQILINGLVVQFFMLVCIFIGNADIEIMRLRFNQYSFPMKKMLQKTRRSTEIKDTSASMLLLLGLASSSIILTYFPDDVLRGIYAQMGVICIAVFSDMFAALIGRKWGKHKWKKICPGKSIEGTLAGFSVGFFTAMIFVGPLLALIGVLIFTFTDLVLDKVKLSDNGLNPILIAIAYKLLIFLVSPMITILPIIKIW
ncbi:MAG: phosphatidate cytidylyltransferase [Promethearchaeota archaeon]